MSLLPTTKSKPNSSIQDKIILIYGAPKTGKSTFASYFDNALFLDFEGGLNFLEVAKVPVPTWQHFLSIKAELLQRKHEYKTIVFDIVDFAVRLCKDSIVKANNVSHISDLAWGKGSDLFKTEWNKHINELKLAGFGIVFLSHAVEKTHSTKTLTVTIMGPTVKDVEGMCDVILYTYINSDSKRLMRTKPHRNIIAGDRSGKLPEVMDLDFNQFKNKLEQPTTTTNTKET